MNERDRASSALLEELGWLTVQWARLEAYIDLISAYLAHKHGSHAVPRPFNARVKFIRTAFASPALINVREDGVRMLDQALALSRKRNDLVHGIVVGWSEDGEMLHTILKSTERGYVAIQDISLKIGDLKALSSDVQRVSARLFGLLERVKSIFRLFDGEDGFQNLARLRGDRD